jgi:hypothetical protein
MRAMFDIRQNLAPCRSIRTQLVGDHALRYDAQLPQQSGQQASCGFGVASALHNLIENIAIRINGAPQPVLLVMATSSRYQISSRIGCLQRKRRA